MNYEMGVDGFQLISRSSQTNFFDGSIVNGGAVRSRTDAETPLHHRIMTMRLFLLTSLLSF